MAEQALIKSSGAALVNGLADAKRELFNLRFQLATGQLENTTRMKLVKKDIARINTEIRAREIAQGDEPAEALDGEVVGTEAGARAGSPEGDS